MRDRIADLQRQRVPFRYAQAQHERLLADRGDRVAVQHHGALGQRHRDHAAGDRRQHLALLQVLLRHGALGSARAQDGGGDLHRGARLVHRGARAATLTEQRLGPRQIGLRLRELRLQSGDLRVERVDLQQQLVVADHGDDLALGDRVALAHRQAGDRAADARACRHDIGAFDRGEHRLLVDQRLEPDRMRRLGHCRSGEGDEHCRDGTGQQTHDPRNHHAASQRETSSARGSPPACTSLPSITMPGVAIAP